MFEGPGEAPYAPDPDRCLIGPPPGWPTIPSLFGAHRRIRSGGEGSVGIPHPMFPPWANHTTSELLLKVWRKREGWCGPPMVGRPVITVTPARAFCTGLEVGGFRFVELYLTT